MIPLRVKMAGFLSFKDEQEIDFEGASIWMLAGNNGSGKSSIFDGVTYALFGHHRGGSQQTAGELINKDCNALTVEFDFRLDRQVYRIKRTLRRLNKGNSSGTQQLFERQDNGEWRPVPDTTKKVDFDHWIQEKIGLTYETFTSSVLLLQGKAEKLLDSKPTGRAEVLASIVNIDRYQRLYDKANNHKLRYKSLVEAVSHQSAAIPEVSDEEYARATQAIQEAELARSHAQAALDSCQAIAAEAERWRLTVQRLEQARARRREAERLLESAAKIERDMATLQELQRVLPTVQTIVTMRAQIIDSEKSFEHLQRQSEDAQERKRRADQMLAQLRSQRQKLQQQRDHDEKLLSEGNTRLRELTAILEIIKQLDDQLATITELEGEGKRFPINPAEEEALLQRECEQLTELNRILPMLERFSNERQEWITARDRLQSLQQERDRIISHGKDCKAEHAKLQQAEAIARQRRAAADEQVAVAKTLLDQASLAAAEFATLSGEKICHACGQPLTAAHYEQEKRRRDIQLQEATRNYQAAVDVRATAAYEEQLLAEQVATVQGKLLQLREEYLANEAEIKHLSAEIKRLSDSLACLYAEIPEPYRSRISPAPFSDYSQTVYPNTDQLIQLRHQVEQLPRVKASRDAAAVKHSQWKEWQTRLAAAKATSDRLRNHLPPGDLTRLQEEYHHLHTQEITLIQSLKATKHALFQADTELDRWGLEAHQAIQSLTELTGKLQAEASKQQQCQQAIERARKNLPPDWQAKADQARMADYHRWSMQCDELRDQGTEGKFQQLEQARGSLQALHRDESELQAEEQAFSAACRQAPEVLERQLIEARNELERCEQQRQDAIRHRDQLDSYRLQRARLGEELTRLDALYARYKILAELLGRDRLQRHLVRQAERQIIDHANAVLDRLSGGQLFLRLSGSDEGTAADKALELECFNRSSGGSPINVAFLSGSQRFRVAVSLALGIGQYASRQHRPIESVIIDEGFGCLDRQGRQVMLQELQNLRGHLNCILLVSHQEEFADAFPDGYHFRLENGATRIQRFSR